MELLEKQPNGQLCHYGVSFFCGRIDQHMLQPHPWLDHPWVGPISTYGPYPPQPVTLSPTGIEGCDTWTVL